jgi:hypothetical protein
VLRGVGAADRFPTHSWGEGEVLEMYYCEIVLSSRYYYYYYYYSSCTYNFYVKINNHNLVHRIFTQTLHYRVTRHYTVFINIKNTKIINAKNKKRPRHVDVRWNIILCHYIIVMPMLYCIYNVHDVVDIVSNSDYLPDVFRLICFPFHVSNVPFLSKVTIYVQRNQVFLLLRNVVYSLLDGFCYKF